MRRPWRGLALLAIGTALTASVWSTHVAAQPLLVLSEDRSSVFAGRYLSILKDEQGRWPITAVTAASRSQLFETSSTLVPILGYSRASFWIRLQITRTSETQEDWFLSIDNKSIDHIEFYVAEVGGHSLKWVTGDSHPFATRIIPERHFVFPITVPDTVTVIHLRLASSGPLYLPIRLLSADALLEDTRRAHFRIGGLFGILVVIALFHLVFYLAVRDFTYLVYVGFLGALILYNLSVERFAFQYFWPDNPWLADRSSSMIGLVCAIMAVEFTRAFLDTRSVAPVWDRRLRLAQVGCAVLMVMFVGGLSRSLGVITNVYFAAMVLMVILVSIAGIRRGQPASIVFLTAWSFLLIGTFVSTMGNLGVLPPQHFAGSRGMQAGSVVTLTLFALALGQRLNRMVRAREELRLRIANDLHDDIGAGLTQIVMGSYLLRQKSESVEGSRLAMEIESQARALSDSMRDVVWTVSPTKESWNDMEDRLHDVAASLLGPAGILIDLKGQGGVDGRVLPLDVRQTVLHTFKETAHNAVKHAHCSRFEARWRVDGERVWMRIRDDGIGFQPEAACAGHGIESLRRRVSAAKGRFTIRSAPGEGTVTEIELPLS